MRLRIVREGGREGGREIVHCFVEVGEEDGKMAN